MGVQVSDSLQLGSVNTPLDARSRIAALSDIPTIALPSVGMIFYCEATGKHYTVKSLKAKQIGAISQADAQVDAYEALPDKADLDGKAASTHNHDAVYAASTHNHDGVYAKTADAHSHLNKSVLDKFSFSGGKLYFDGAEVILSTSHTTHTWSNGTCSVCGLAHTPHTWSNGVCTVCGLAHTPHAWSNGTCSACGIVHDPHTWSNGTCTVCGLVHASHTWDKGTCSVCGLAHTPHTWSNGTCSVCGLAHTPHAWSNGTCSACGIVHDPHTWSNGVCTVCGLVHASHTWDKGTCSVCGLAHTPHTWSNGVCTVCGFVCTHTWVDSTCSICGKVCSHNWTSDGLCSICGKARATAKSPAMAYPQYPVCPADTKTESNYIVYDWPSDLEFYYGGPLGDNPVWTDAMVAQVELYKDGVKLTPYQEITYTPDGYVPLYGHSGTRHTYAGRRGYINLYGKLPTGSHTLTIKIIGPAETREKTVVFDWTNRPSYITRPPGAGKWTLEGVSGVWVYTDTEWIQMPAGGIGPEYAGHPVYAPITLGVAGAEWCPNTFGWWSCDGAGSDYFAIGY